MNKKMLNILFILVGVIAVYCTYQFYYVKNNTKVESVQSETKTYQDRINELDILIGLEPTYDAEITNDTKDITDKSQEFTQTINEEDVIIYAVDMEKEEENLLFTEVNMPDLETVDTIDGAGISCEIYKASPTLTFSSDYDTAKEVAYHVGNDEDAKRTITTLDYTYDNTNGELTGVITYAQYFVTNYGEDREDPDIDKVDTGTDNIFGGIEDED